MIDYRIGAGGLIPDQLDGGFFAGWLERPHPAAHLRLLRQSDVAIVAVDETTEKVVGYVTALTDRVLSAFVTYLEVLPDYRNRGIGTDLMRAVLAELEGTYAIDLVCDPELEPFYAHLGLQRGFAMVWRDYDAQGGRPG